MNLGSILIGSEHPERLIDYYTGIFGEPLWSLRGYAGWQIGNGWLTIGPHDQVHGKNVHPGRVLWNIETTDVLGDFERLKAMGARVVTEPYQPIETAAGWVATFADPDDNYFQLHRFRELGLMESIAVDAERTRPDLSRAVAPEGTVTVLFTDIEASTPLNELLGDRQWMAVLREHNAIVRERLALNGGFEVKAQGDGFMLAFASAPDALRCAIGIQRALADARPQGVELRVRIGLHTGKPIQEAADFYGKVVVLAARIAAEARASQILVSRTVRRLTEASGEFAFGSSFDVELRGLSGKHRLAAVRWREDDDERSA